MLKLSFYKSSIIACLGLILFSCILSAQDDKKYAQAKVVTNNNDTITGNVKVKNFSLSPLSKELTLYENGKEMNTYYPADIKNFFFNNRYFEAVYLATPACVYCKKNVFVERIEHGKIDLFFFFDCKATVDYTLNGTALKCINYYYIRKNEKDTLFLAYRERQNLAIVSQPNNFEDFCNFFKDNSKIYTGLLNKKYGREDIGVMVRAYNSGIDIDSLKKQEETPMIEKIILPSNYDVNNIDDYYVRLNEELKKHEILCEIEYERKKYDDGKIKSQGYYIATCDYLIKLPVGVWVSYNKNGTLKKIEGYNQRGERNGTFKYFNEDGELIETVEYEKDKKL